MMRKSFGFMTSSALGLLKSHLSFLFFYTRAKLEAESFRHFAGYLWWILDPLFGVGVYYILFKVFLNRGGPDYIEFLFIGLVTWKWFGDSLSKSSASIISNLSLMKRVRIRKHVFPTVEVFYNTWKFLVVFCLMVIFYALWGYKVSLYHLYLFPLLLCQFVLVLGGSYFLASLIPFFPDLKFIVTYSLRLLFYPSGILFSLSMVPEKYVPYIKLNPMAGIVDSYRQIIMKGGEPDFVAMMYSLTLGLALAGIGIFVIRKNELNYPKLS